MTTLSEALPSVSTRKELADAVGIGEVTMGKVMQIDENAPDVIKEALDKKELSINKGYDLTRQLQGLPEEQREQAAAEALEYEKAKKELKKQDAEIDRKGKIAALFCKAYEKAVLLTPSEENVRCWTDGTRMTPEKMRDTVKESRELAEVSASTSETRTKCWNRKYKKIMTDVFGKKPTDLLLDIVNSFPTTVVPLCLRRVLQQKMGGM